MDLDVAALDDAREAWRSGHRNHLHRAALSTMTLGACVEAACWGAAGDDDLRALLQRWAVLVPNLCTALSALTTGADLPCPDDHDAPDVELMRCPTRAELVDHQVGLEWRYFLDRFRRSLTTKLCLPGPKARGITAALNEMVDNVVDHAGLGDSPAGVVAYEVSDEHFGLAVGDLGRGVLASLRENVAHAALSTDAEALLSAVTRGASRRVGIQGKGFSDLVRALADLEGSLSFRSGSARLGIDGRGTNSRAIVPSNSPILKGFQLSVIARPKKSSW